MFQVPDGDGNMASTSNLNNFENHTTDINIPVFDENFYENNSTVTTQPTQGRNIPNTNFQDNIYANQDDNESSMHSIDGLYQGAESRRPIPVSTVDWQSRNNDQFFPISGLDFLRGVQMVGIEQTVELSDLMANVSLEKRYLVRVPQGGETLYRGSEESTNFQRSCFGSSRAFNMTLYDHTQQEVLLLKKRFTCCALLFLEQLEIWASPGELIGTVEQLLSFSVPTFLVHDRHKNLQYRIEGPPLGCGCIVTSKDIYFRIYTGDGRTHIGNINNQWDQISGNYNLLVTFPNRRDDTRHKALLLGAAFLFEFLYFERQK